MMGKKSAMDRNQVLVTSLDELVPADHLVRKLEKALDLGFVYPQVEDLYSSFGAESIDPVVLIKINIVQYTFGIRSMRQTLKDIAVNTAYRWYLGYGLYEKLPHFSTFSKNYTRRFEGTDLFEQIFRRIIEEIVKRGFLDEESVFIDGTHVKASANNHKYRKEIVIFHKGEHKKVFAYGTNVACDKHGYVMDLDVTAGNLHDSVVFPSIYRKLVEHYDGIKNVVVDAGYKTPAIAREIINDGKTPFMPYKRPMTKEGFFKIYEYVYDEESDCYKCPNNAVLKYSTTNRRGYREYKSDAKICADCPYLTKCTNNKNHVKLITRHVWEGYLEQAEKIRKSNIFKETYDMRKETIERVFAGAKELHGMRYAKHRGLPRVKMELTLLFSCMNLKKLAKKLWVHGCLFVKYSLRRHPLTVLYA
jgi:transposase